MLHHGFPEGAEVTETPANRMFPFHDPAAHLLCFRQVSVDVVDLEDRRGVSATHPSPD